MSIAGAGRPFFTKHSLTVDRGLNKLNLGILTSGCVFIYDFEAMAT